MEKSVKSNTAVKLTTYIAGIIITALGINILLRSRLGAGAWDTVTNNLSVLTNISLGMASALINVIILLFIVIYNKNYKFFLILVPIAGVAISIDFWDLIVFKDFQTNILSLRFLMFISGAVTLTLGLALMIATTYKAMVFDELTLSLMRLFKIKQFLTMRLIIELFAIALATLFGFMAGIGFGAVNLGSLILAVTIGSLITFHLKWIKVLSKR